VSNYESATKPSGMMEIELNGERRQVPQDATLAEILMFLGLPRDRVAVELNRSIIRKTDWESCRVEAGSEVEVVHFVGGGSDHNHLQVDRKR
jgi:sulfur carrier protein